jgi:nucleotide-binding universal stress UspA family protein
MTTFHRLLLPTNFSEVSAHAAHFAGPLAEKCGATLYVLHAYQPMPLPEPTTQPGLGGMVLLPDEAELREALDAFVRSSLAGIQVRVVSEVRGGAPVRVITDYTREMAIDLIVLGTHARGLFPRLLAGSVSKAVLESAHCAVLMIPAAAAEPVDVLEHAAVSGTELGHEPI